MNSMAKAPPGNKPGQSLPPTLSATNPSLLDKLNGRRSTPDSEAMASSDDEGEASRQESIAPPTATQKPVRRASWLNDTTQPLSQPRKASFASSTRSPTTSHPSTPSTETGAWGSHIPSTAAAAGRGTSGSTSFPWGQGIWNSDSRKEPPSRLMEVLPSPPGIAGGYGYGVDSNGSAADSTLPFAIPLHPTPKTYRSQSYSVGQLDLDSAMPGAAISSIPSFSGRGRGLHHSGLQHRPSRPSMLSEMSSDGTGLGKLKEVDDDDLENSDNTSRGTQLQDQAKVLEALARENAILRQQHYQNSRLRPASSTGLSSGYASSTGHGIHDPLSQESDYAIDEVDEMGDLQGMGNRSILTRRMSEYGPGQLGKSGGSAENRKLENVKKAYWQSSLGFGGPSDLPQSRRHSFADIPTRHASISSLADSQGTHQDMTTSLESQSRYVDAADYSVNDHAASYFGGVAVQPRITDSFGTSPYPSSSYQSYNMAVPHGGMQPTSPHRNMYSVPQPRHNQLLYIVLFKCSRADVFYVQEGTGLSVKPGDLVIVEADRGTDLGTVAQDNVDWAQAKELKEHYAEEHYKWLMMYSQGAVGTADGTGAGLMAASNGMQGSAVGGMGPPTQHGMQEPNSGELKPKIIKRLAQNHEIQALRDKEGNEAKAKRVCMQKVKEHGLHMEILDAEFQMDWKKLTFYYFADAYINFNSLVTDLFKVYKTRIWMSAINPASFASPSLGIQAPSGVGPGAVGANRQAQMDRRHQQQQQQQQEQPNYTNSAQSNRGYSGVPLGLFNPSLERGPLPSNSFQQPFAYGYSAFGTAPRNGSAGYGPNMLQQIDPFAAFAANPEYHGIPGRFPSPHNVSLGQEPVDYGRHGNSNDQWVNSFKSLSLNSR